MPYLYPTYCRIKGNKSLSYPMRRCLRWYYSANLKWDTRIPPRVYRQGHCNPAHALYLSAGASSLKRVWLFLLERNTSSYLLLEGPTGGNGVYLIIQLLCPILQCFAYSRAFMKDAVLWFREILTPSWEPTLTYTMFSLWGTRKGWCFLRVGCLWTTVVRWLRLA